MLLPVTPVDAPSGAVSGTLAPGAPLTLDTVGPDGATYHAEFPVGATAYPVTVTMQPLESVDGLSGAVEAVSFEPSGLLLVKPAVLTIDGPVADAAAARGFGYQVADGTAVAGPAIIAPLDGPMRLIIGHFSGYGAAADDPPQWNIGTITAAEASEIIALEDFVIANTLRGLKNHLLTQDQADETIANALDAVNTATERLGKSAVEAAKKGDVSAATQVELAAAVQVILASARADQLMGRPGDPNALALVGQIISTFLGTVIHHCETAHDLTVLTLLLTLSRQSQLLGIDDAAQQDGLRSCTAAKVHFVTTITASLAPSPVATPGTFGGVVTIDVSAPINLFDGLPSPDVPYTATSTIVFKDDTCTVTESIDSATFSVQLVTLKQSPPPAKPASPPAAPSSVPHFVPVAPLVFTDALVLLSIATPQVENNLSGSCGPSDPTPQFVSDWFDQLHPAEAKGGGGYLFDSGFTIPADGSAVLARRTIDRTVRHDTDGSVNYQSTTQIEIVHDPG